MQLPDSGLDQPFDLLFEAPAPDGHRLPMRYTDVYRGSWNIPERADRPFVYSNFVISRDGRVSFMDAGKAAAALISEQQSHDRWIMALLRARADAVMVGEGTLRIEGRHIWTAEHIFPEASPGFFQELRRMENRAVAPLQCFVSLAGDIDAGASVFHAGLRVIIATTHRGAPRLRAQFAAVEGVNIIEFGEDKVDLGCMLATLQRDYGVRTLLCEGGPRLYAQMLAAQLIDEEFLTLSPVVVGEDEGLPRPSLVEGVGFRPDNYPRSLVTSVRRFGHYIYLRANYEYRAA